jgi:uncharacterized protein YbjT (DUF2867 family)
MSDLDLKIRKASKTALIFGATGLVGAECLKQLIADDSYSKILVFNRKLQNYSSDKVEEIIIDYDHLNDNEDQMRGDDVYICLGTTMAKAGSKKAFIKVDYTYIMKAALAALRQGANQLLMVSAAGSDRNSYIFYNRVKGELESDISMLDYWAIHIFKPSLLLGERKEKRKIENIASKFAVGIDRLFGPKLAAYRPVQASDVARAMTRTSDGLQAGVHYYNSNEIVNLGQ